MSWLHRTKKSTSEEGGYQYLLVGLGNPGKNYENTRHNVGFRALDAIAAAYGAKLTRLKMQSLMDTCTIAGKKCVLMKPCTYMNLSGQAVVKAMQFYHIPPERTIIFYDDISLDLAKVRIRRKGSDGGHNGMKNIIYLSGKDTFPRVKIGIGAKPHPDYPLADWVLSSFRKEENAALEEVFQTCPAIAALLVQDKVDQAMNQFNR